MGELLLRGDQPKRLGRLLKEFREQSDRPMPWPLYHIRYCMDAHGSFVSFPWGTYREQLDKPHGRTQIQLMAYLWRIDGILAKDKRTLEERTEIKKLTGWEMPTKPDPVPFDKVLETYGP